MLTLMIVMIFICGSLGIGGYLIEKSEKPIDRQPKV